MKRILFIAAALMAACSCEQTGTEPEVEAGYYIYADKEIVEADGKDMAAFVVKDQDGNVISTENNMGVIWYENVATEVRLPRYSTGFTSIVDGDFEFAGIVNGTKTLNTVKVKVQNRAKYEVFHRNVAIFKLTGTWCTNCPSMTTVLNGLGEDAKAHSVILACHWNDGGYSIPYSDSGQDLAAAAALHVNPSLSSLSVPSNIYDLAIHEGTRTVSGITDIIMNRRIESPATTGIKVTSVAMDGSDLKVKAVVKSSTGGEYDLTCAVLADNVNAGGAGSADGYYHHMVISVNQENFMSLSKNTRFALEADGEYEREFVFPLNGLSSDMLENVKVAVLSLKNDESGKAVVDNVVECPYGKTVDYLYN